jgi:hypothetical protein
MLQLAMSISARSGSSFGSLASVTMKGCCCSSGWMAREARDGWMGWRLGPGCCWDGVEAVEAKA